MSSSKFSSPFFKKSPLLGAYGSGADSIVTVSDLPHYQKLQQDLVGGTLAVLGAKGKKLKTDKQIEAKLALDNMPDGKEKNEAQTKYNITYGKTNKCDGQKSGTIFGTGSSKITCP
jgi:hypothetical protein